MRLETVLEQVTSKGPLMAVAKSIDVYDAARSTIEQLRELLLVNLRNPETVASQWDSLVMREKLVLFGLLQNAGSRTIEIGKTYELLASYFEELHTEARSDAALDSLYPSSVNAYKGAVQVALRDERITRDERALLNAFREGIGMTHRHEILAFAQIGLFENLSERPVMNDVLPGLLKKGLLFEIGTGRRKSVSPSYVIPFEVVHALKGVLGLGVSDRNMKRFLASMPKTLLERTYEHTALPPTRGAERIIERLVRAEISLSDLLRALDKVELRAICYRAGWRPSGRGKNELINEIVSYASVDDQEDLPSGVALDEQLSPEKVEQLVRFWKDVDRSILEAALASHQIPLAPRATKLAENILESRVPMADLLGHTCVNAEVLAKLVDRMGQRVMRSKSDNLKKILVHLNDTDRDLVKYLPIVAMRDVGRLSSEGFAFHNDELPNLFERLTKYVFDSAFDVEVVRHPHLNSSDGRDHFPDGAIGLNDKRVVLWDNKASAGEYEITTLGKQPHFDQFVGYISAFRNTYPEKDLLALVVVAGVFGRKAVETTSRIKEVTNCDVCILSAQSLSLLSELSTNANDAARSDLNLFNLTGELDHGRIRTRLSAVR